MKTLNLQPRETDSASTDQNQSQAAANVAVKGKLVKSSDTGNDHNNNRKGS